MQTSFKKKRVIWIIVAVIVLLVIVVLNIKVQGGSAERKVIKQLSMGAKYLSEMKYEEAIIAFENAIQIDPKNVAAYIVLAEVYEETGDYDKAEDVLERVKEAFGTNEQITKKMQEVSEMKNQQVPVLEPINTSSDTQDEGKSNSDLYMGSISDIEYAFILWSFRDQVVSKLNYTLYDADGDGTNELLINAITDEDNGMYTQFIADSNEKRYQFRGYTPTGAAESSQFCIMKGYDTILWNTDYSTMEYVESHYYQWKGTNWKEIKELNGISFDYENTVEFDCPNVLNIGVAGNSEEIFDEIDYYFENRDGSYSASEADLDSDGQVEKVYYVLSAGNKWYESLYMENTTENQSFQDHRDIYMTVVIADKTADGVVLRPVRVKYRGSKIEIIDDTLYINDVAYEYTDTQSQYTTPCLQTVLKSPGTYGEFDSKGNRTILSMVNMPFYDINKMCTDITLYEKDSSFVTAMFGNSRCNFEFLIVTDNNSLSSASPAYSVKVMSWNLVTGGMTIDNIPVIGDFCMGDSIGELKTIMIPSTEWKPLLFGQDFLANTNFYYRPSYENENVYFVEVWTDGEGEDSKVCGIRFEEIIYPDDETKEVLGLQ